LFPSGGLFIRELPALAFHGINRDSAGNYQLNDEESTGGMVIPPGIAISLTRNLEEEGLFSRKLPAQ
jgi:hypothetical protein